MWEGSQVSASVASLLHAPSPGYARSAQDTDCVPGAWAWGAMRSSSRCTWLVGPSINDFVHFWASEGWPGRVSLGWGLGQMTED